CSGIWQTVWLESVPKTYIRSILLEPDLEQRTMWVTADVVGDDAGEYQVRVETMLPPPDEGGGERVASKEKEPFKPGERGKLPVTAKGVSMHVWSPDDPFLYDLKVSIQKPGAEKAADLVQSYFAMRKLEVASDGKFQRLKLNGKEIMLIGP